MTAHVGQIAIFAFLCLGASAGTAAAASCGYMNLMTDEMLNGKCSRSWSDATDTETWKLKGKTITLKIIDRQGQWARVLLNGKPGARYEHNRTSFSVTTDDLKETFDY